MLSPSDRAIARRFRDRLLALGVPLEEFLVFGSRARGDARIDSDLDVFLRVSRRDRETTFKIMEAADDAERDSGASPPVILPVIATSAEVETPPWRGSPLLADIRKEGIAV